VANQGGDTLGLVGRGCEWHRMRVCSTWEWFGNRALNGLYYGMRSSLATTWEEIEVQDTGIWDVTSMRP
jgi:hypothetical protein